MKNAPGRILPAALLVLALAGPGAASADEASDLRAARAAFHEASSFARQKRWSEACDRYALSLKLHPAALTLYSLGVAQREAGRLVAARATFLAFLAEPVTARTLAFTEPARSAVAELTLRAASLAVVLAPEGLGPAADVTLDGVSVPVGTLAQARPVDPGLHEVVARAPGRIEARSQITLPEGGSATLTLTLLPSPGAAGALVATKDGLPGAPEKPRDRGAPWPPALPFALLGVGGAAIVGGVALGLSGFVDSRGATSGSGATASDARAKGLAGDILAASGIAVAGVGLVLFLVQQSRPPAQTGRVWATSASGLSVTF